jgi:hypothetical protein
MLFIHRLLVCAFQPGTLAEPVPVPHIEEPFTAFSCRARKTAALAVGDLFQVIAVIVSPLACLSISKMVRFTMKPQSFLNAETSSS